MRERRSSFSGFGMCRRASALGRGVAELSAQPSPCPHAFCTAWRIYQGCSDQIAAAVGSLTTRTRGYMLLRVGALKLVEAITRASNCASGTAVALQSQRTPNHWLAS